MRLVNKTSNKPYLELEGGVGTSKETLFIPFHSISHVGAIKQLQAWKVRLTLTTGETIFLDKKTAPSEEAAQKKAENEALRIINKLIK